MCFCYAKRKGHVSPDGHAHVTETHDGVEDEAGLEGGAGARLADYCLTAHFPARKK